MEWIVQPWPWWPDSVIGISEATLRDLKALGITDVRGFVPADLISFSALAGTWAYAAPAPLLPHY